MQETRDDFRHNEGGRNQAEQIAECLGYRHTYQRGMQYSAPPLRIEEGISILTRHPILEWNARPLPRTEDPEDRHQRVVLRALIATPLGAIHFFCTHWSLARRTRRLQALALCEAVNHVESRLPKFVCGDFNAEPEAEEIRFLTGAAEVNGRRGNFVDLWRALRPQDVGVTFPGAEAERARRIDYVFAVPGREAGIEWVRSIDIAFTETDASGTRASDHLGLDVVLSTEAWRADSANEDTGLARNTDVR
ncbi:MAG: endonuclease/exonuclease/phosphatase family protein [Armatimonadota bacterium]